VEVAGRTLLDITLERLRGFGIREVIVNVHHFGEMVVAYLKKHDDLGMLIEISREEELLDTGGGLKKAAWFFQDSDEPFLLHNVDVISSIDLGRMVEVHRKSGSLATLAVQERETSRYLLFDEQDQLCGRRAGRDGAAEMVRAAQVTRALAFSGVHVISPRLLNGITEDGAFSIIASYLRMAGAGESISAFRADEYYWRDLGKPENVEAATEDVERGVVRI